ncbi:endonuclease V isoform X2 [Folsomia candida]|nr:endonuclease V isoform X2 [Folsomia candida]XP_035707156.1 endonuclease V isoform X2 [Folsomia candida]XP_035707157.1 endonuclease V isoform X2 [Folsomia candida]
MSDATVDSALIEKWTKVQNDLRSNIITSDSEEWQSDLNSLKLVAGLDISYPKDAHDKSHSDAYAALVICKFPSMEIVHQDVELCQPDVPYVPGFLAFRELPPLLNLVNKLLKEHPEFKPDVILVDGNGLLHPQKCGVACHIGYHTSICTIGVAKNLFVMENVNCTKAMVQNMGGAGDFTLIKDNENCILGLALKSAEEAKNPIYVSIGHKICLESSRKTVLACCKYRVPEPLRFADGISREFVRQLLAKTDT